MQKRVVLDKHGVLRVTGIRRVARSLADGLGLDLGGEKVGCRRRRQGRGGESGVVSKE